MDSDGTDDILHFDQFLCFIHFVLDLFQEEIFHRISQDFFQEDSTDPCFLGKFWKCIKTGKLFFNICRFSDVRSIREQNSSYSSQERIPMQNFYRTSSSLFLLLLFSTGLHG